MKAQLLFVVSTVTLFLTCDAAPVKKHAPHLFFILVDDMGFNDFSYRSSDLSSVAWPNVNKLVSESLKVDTYYTQALCSPTRGAFMTGRFPVRLGLQHGVIEDGVDQSLPLDEVTLADKLKHAGYATHAVGKWHLGSYNFESTPTYRGFDTYLGYYSGASDYWTHMGHPYLDLHRQWNTSNPEGLLNNGTYMAVRNESGVYSTDLFAAEMTASIKTHKAKYDSQPGFFYLPLQNVHAPLESPGGKYEQACAGIPNADRKTFCAMAAIADEAIGNLTALIKEEFAEDEYLVVISGDNGGMPNSAGNNFPLRGHKAELWEGGVRNNAIVLGSKLPKNLAGTTYTGGMMHITDWHATFAALGGATLKPKAALDGNDMWSALTTGAVSPRTELLHNYDSCSGHGSCAGVEWAYRLGDLKMTSGVAYDTWYSLPTSDSDTSELKASSAQMDTSSGHVWWPENHYLAAMPNASAAVGLGPICAAAVKKACPSDTAESAQQICAQCVAANWGTISQSCRVSEARVAAAECSSGGSTSGLALFNISADPYEQHNLIVDSLGSYSAIVAEIQGKVDAIVKSGDYMIPCSIPGGSCSTANPLAAQIDYAHDDSYPWVGTTR